MQLHLNVKLGLTNCIQTCIPDATLKLTMLFDFLVYASGPEEEIKQHCCRSVFRSKFLKCYEKTVIHLV